MPTVDGLMVSAEASDGLLLGAAPNLEYDLVIAPGPSGELTVSGSHTAFPSLEVWVYEDRKEPQLIYAHEATADSFVEGVKDINRTVHIPE